jgi:hypothetical protein
MIKVELLAARITGLSEFFLIIIGFCFGMTSMVNIIRLVIVGKFDNTPARIVLFEGTFIRTFWPLVRALATDHLD